MTVERKEDLDLILMASLAAGKSTQEAADEGGVSYRTVYRRLKEKDFRQGVADLRARMIDNVAGRITDAAGTAFGRLQELLAADSEQVQLGAARTILDQMIRLRDVVDFETRLRRIEELCSKKRGSQNWKR